MKNIQEYQKIMLDNNYKNFENEYVIKIAYSMYSFILKQNIEFQNDLGIPYSVSAINRDYAINIRKKYSVFISIIQELNQEQLNAMISEVLSKWNNFELEITYYNTLDIINYHVDRYSEYKPEPQQTLFQ